MTDLSTRFRRALGRIGELPAGQAYLGKGDGSGTIIADYTNRLAWYSGRNQPPALARVPTTINIMSLNNPALEGLFVRIGYHPEASDRLHILGVDAGEGQQSLGGIMPAEQLQAAALYPSASNLMPLRLAPEATPSMSVYVNPGAYWERGTGIWAWMAGNYYDATSDIAALTSGQHQFLLVCLDTTDGAIAGVLNTASTGSEKSVFNAMTISALSIPAAYMPCGAVHLYYGQTSIVETDIYRDFDTRVQYAANHNPGISSAVVTKTGNYTATGIDHTILVDASGGAVTITLPTAASAYVSSVGREYVIKKIDASGYTVTVDGAGSELIDGALTQSISAQWTALKLQSNGSAWYIL